MEVLDSWVLTPGRLLACWCDRCRVYHFHGNVGRGTMRGALVAHCLTWGGMYRLRVHGVAPEEIVKDVARRRPEGPRMAMALAAIEDVDRSED